MLLPCYLFHTYWLKVHEDGRHENSSNVKPKTSHSPSSGGLQYRSQILHNTIKQESGQTKSSSVIMLMYCMFSLFSLSARQKLTFGPSPLPSHPDTVVIPWRQGKTHAVVMYLQCKAVSVSFG